MSDNNRKGDSGDKGNKTTTSTHTRITDNSNATTRSHGTNPPPKSGGGNKKD